MSGRLSSRPYAARPSPLYRLALGAVAVTMAILPVFYVALIVLAGYGVYLFATLYFTAVWAWPIGNNRVTLPLKVVCSCTPLLSRGGVRQARSNAERRNTASVSLPVHEKAWSGTRCRLAAAGSLRRISRGIPSV